MIGWVHVKNVHLRRSGRLAEFPDCVAARSARHLRELEAMTAAADRAVALFVVQRTDCDAFAPAADLDPVFARGLAHAFSAGVEVLCYACERRAAGRGDRQPPALARRPPGLPLRAAA